MNPETTRRSPQHFFAQRLLVVLFASLVGLLLALGLVAGLDALNHVRAAWAATMITVNTTNDELTSDGDCSLREAIQAANTDTAVDACPAGSGADTITLPAGTYTLTLAGAGEDGNATGDLDITGPLTLDGAEMATTIINANALDRALHVPTTGVTLTLLNLTVRNGRAPGDSGGGLLASGPVVVSSTTFLSNTATFLYSGGGAFFGGAATVTGTTFLGNRAYFGGGALFDGAATVTGTTFLGNTASASGGGALFDGAATVMGTTFNGNTATNGHGGGAYFNGAATVMGTTFLSNTANGKGGGAYFYGLGGAATGHFVNTLFAANHANSNRGAGLYAENFGSDDVVTLRHVTIASPTVGSGSAVYVLAGTVNLTNTILASYSVGLERAGGVLNENYNLFSGVATTYAARWSAGVIRLLVRRPLPMQRSTS